MSRYRASAQSRAAYRRPRHDRHVAGKAVTTMLQVEDLSKSFGGVAAMQNVTLDFPAGSLTAIIGPNGAGKTTFFNLISGAMRPDRGRVKLAGEEIGGLSPREIVRRGIVRAFQIASIFPSLTVDEILTAAVQAHMGNAERILRRFPLPECRDRAAEVMTMLGLSDKAAVMSSSLSHGDQKLLDIGLALALEPRVLLLDDIVFKIAQTIRVLCYGRVLAEGTPAEIRGHPEVIAAYLGTSQETRGS
jgi:branched-chain amino acid transport system ATP-binding protein